MYNYFSIDFKKTIILLTILLIIPVLIWGFSTLFSYQLESEKINKLNVFIDTDKPISRYLSGDFVQINHNSKYFGQLDKFADIVNQVEIHLTNSGNSDRFLVYNPFKDGEMKYSLNFPSQEQQQFQIVYDKNISTLFFRKSPQEIYINTQLITDGGENIYKIENISLGDTLKIADKYIMVNKDGIVANISETYLKNQIEKLTISNVNLLENQNESFQDGPWQNVVSDCEKDAEGDPILEMKVESVDKSLSLAAQSHSACTFKDFELPLKPLHDHVFSIDYNNIEGNSGSVYLNFIDGREKQVYDEIGNPKYVKQQQESQYPLLDSDQNWQTFSTVLSNKLKDPFLFEVYLYTRNQQNSKERTLFDNLRLNEVISTSIVNLESIPELSPVIEKPIKLDQGENELTFKLDTKNLIIKDNFSFEEGLWQTFPNDCSDYLPGYQKFESKLSTDHTNGKFSLNLISRDHFACVFRKYTTTFLDSLVYKLSFDYKILEGEKAQYYIKAVSKSDENVNATFSESLTSSDQNWHTQSIILDSYIKDIQYLEIYLYAPSSGERSSILYDNIEIVPAYPRNIENFVVSGLNSGTNEDSKNFAYTKIFGGNHESPIPDTIPINSEIDYLVRNNINENVFKNSQSINYISINYFLTIYFVFALSSIFLYFTKSKYLSVFGNIVKKIIIDIELSTKVSMILIFLIIILVGFIINFLLASLLALTIFILRTKLPSGILSVLSYILIVIGGVLFVNGNISIAETLSTAAFLLIIFSSLIEIFRQN